MLPVLLGEWVYSVYNLYVCSAYIRIYTVLPALSGGSFSVIQQYIGCLNGCMQCLLHLCLLYVLSAHLLCGLCMHYITSAVYYSVPPPTPTPCVTRFRHQVSVLRDQSAGQREFGFNNGGTLSIRVRRSHLLQDGLDLLKNVRTHWDMF